MPKKQCNELQNLYFIVEVDEEYYSFICDMNLKRQGEFNGDDYSNCYLFTSDEIETIKDNLGDKAVLLKDEMDEYVGGKYNIIPFPMYFIDDDLQESAFDEENEMYKPYSEDFIEAVSKEYGSQERYWDDVKYRCLQKTRIYKDFLESIDETFEKEQNEWLEKNNLPTD